MLLVLNLGNLVIFGHGQGIIDNLVIGLRVRVDFYELFSAEVVVLALGTDGRFYFPRFGSWVFDVNFLGDLTPDHAVELELLDRFLGLRNALTDQIHIQRVDTLDHTLCAEANVVVGGVRVERHVEKEVFVGQQVPLCRLNREKLAT